MPNDKETDIVRVLRLVEYEGPRDLVEKQIENSIHGTRYGIVGRGLGGGWPRPAVRITAVTLEEFPQVLEEARRVACPKELQQLKKEIECLQSMLEEMKGGADDKG
jgi:hypothetical protein